MARNNAWGGFTLWIRCICAEKIDVENEAEEEKEEMGVRVLSERRSCAMCNTVDYVGRDAFHIIT